MNTRGKAGTITPEEFETLSSMASTYGAKTLASKVAKVCTRIADNYKHEYPGSAVASAWLTAASRISTSVGSASRAVSNDTFDELFNLVSTYGPEVITFKLGKIAARSNNTSDATLLKGIFPRATASNNAA